MKVLGIREIPIDRIETIQGLMPRIYTHTIEEKVEEYKEAMEEGQEFPPITVWQKGNEYWLIDGMHRLLATKRLGKKTIKAEIVKLENEKEARMLAIEKNMMHGIPLDREEKKELARLLYKDGIGVEKLRKLFRVSERTIYYWLGSIKKEKEELKERAKELKEQGLSLREIERELKIDHTTASRWINDTDNLQKCNTFDEIEEDFDYEKLMQIANNPEIAKQAAEYTEQKFYEEQRKSNGGRPPKEPEPASEDDLYNELKDALLSHIYGIAARIGWEKTMKLLDEVKEKVIEMSNQ
jgi:ParB-like chromosome segregation protein Spo0J